MEEVLIIGLDLSMNSSGYAVVKFTSEGIEVIKKGLIKQRGTETHSQKLKRHYRVLNRLKDDYVDENTIIVKEGLHYGRPKTAAILGKAHGVADLIFPSIHTYGASTIKKTIAGRGKATKEEVEQAVQDMVNLGSTPIRFKSDDESDAVAVAITYYIKEFQ